MEILKRLKKNISIRLQSDKNKTKKNQVEVIELVRGFLALPILLLSMSCTNGDGTVTVTYPIETDTYISSQDSNDHSELSFLSVAKSGAAENRILLKFPTGSHDSDNYLNDCINNPYCFVFFLPIAILQHMLSPNCADASYTAANLNWAYLEFETVDGSSPAAGTLQVSLLGQPWWHNVNWLQAHPFTEQGQWSAPGGSIDTSVAFDTSCNNLQGGQSCGAGEVKFEMTDYFKSLLTNANSTHYGMVVSTPVDMPELQLHSAQATGLSQGPRLVANYNCIVTATTETSVYYFGAPIP